MKKSPYQVAIQDYDKNFEKYLNKIFSEYRQEKYSDSLWLAGPTSYVFSLCGQKFAVDMQIRRKIDFEKLMPRLTTLLSDISFVLITHQHDDHMCIPLMRALKDTPIRWYIPRGVPIDLIKASELKEENIVWVSSGDCFSIGDVDIRAFNSPHAPKNADVSGVVEVGYEIITPKGKVLLPADVRDYDYDEYPTFSKVDLCISHLWAGNDALNENLYKPMLEKFALFSSRFKSKRYFLCHLYEIGRTETFMWHNEHANIVIDRLSELLPESVVEIPRLGERYTLFEGEK